MLSQQEIFFRLIRHPLRVRLFLFRYLPSAFFSGVLPVELNENACTVKVPYKWFSRNPFKSTYFACLAMAAEMSTGILALSLVYKRTPGISMLVTHIEADYHKKATEVTYFTCNDGLVLKQIVENAIKDGNSHTCAVRSTGCNAKGEKIAVFTITWSFKARTARTDHRNV
jgi:hypothetical protein